jgi:hypothetical protein
MTQSIHQEEIQKEQKKIKKTSRFDNVVADAVYNIVVWLPVTIISWIFSQFDF